MNHCRTPQSWSLEPVAVQIAARQISSQTADGQGLIRLCKVLYRTLVIESKQPYNRGHAELPPIMALLNAFNNIDKHRLVQVTYNCNSAGQISFTRAIAQIVSRSLWANKSFDNGDEIAYFFSESKSEVPYNFAVSFTIGVSHIPGPGLRTTSPLEGVLVGMLAEVKRIVSEADGIG